MIIYSHQEDTDREVTVDRSDSGELTIRTTYGRGVTLPQSAIAQLCDVLCVYAAPALVEGREYRLLPGAHSGADYGPDPLFGGVTHVRVGHATPDYDGDIRVTLLDGPNAGVDAFVLPYFVVPYGTPELVKDRVYRLLPGAHSSQSERAHEMLRGVSLVKLLRVTPNSNGDVYVTPIDGAAKGYHVYILPRFLAPIADMPTATGDTSKPQSEPPTVPGVDPAREALLRTARDLSPGADGFMLIALARYLSGEGVD